MWFERGEGWMGIVTPLSPVEGLIESSMELPCLETGRPVAEDKLQVRPAAPISCLCRGLPGGTWPTAVGNRMLDFMVPFLIWHGSPFVL